MVTPDGESPSRARVTARLAHLEDEVRAEQLHREVQARTSAGTAQGSRNSRDRRGALPAQDTPSGAPLTDRIELLKHVRTLLLSGEFLHAVFDLKGRGSAFVAVTSRRVILYDRQTHAVLTMPYTRIVGIGLRDTADQFAARGLIATKCLLVTAAGTYDFEVHTPEAAGVLYDVITRYLLSA
jgi:hypothetical protein